MAITFRPSGFIITGTKYVMNSNHRPTISNYWTHLTSSVHEFPFSNLRRFYQCQAKTESTFLTIIQHNSVFWSCESPTPTPTHTPTNTHIIWVYIKENISNFFSISPFYLHFLCHSLPVPSSVYPVSFLLSSSVYPMSFLRLASHRFAFITRTRLLRKPILVRTMIITYLISVSYFIIKQKHNLLMRNGCLFLYSVIGEIMITNIRVLQHTAENVHMFRGEKKERKIKEREKRKKWTEERGYNIRTWHSNIDYKMLTLYNCEIISQD